jgi:RimJ/RimL family protein N-acetyltransferase
MGNIETERLTLVPFDGALLDALSDFNRERIERVLEASVHRAWPGPEFRPLVQLVAAWVRNAPEAGLRFRLVIHRTDNVVIGDVSLLPTADAECDELSYAIAEPYRNRGFATEAAGALVQGALDAGNLRRVVASCERANPASVRVLEKLGMHPSSGDLSTLHWEISGELAFAGRSM